MITLLSSSLSVHSLDSEPTTLYTVAITAVSPEVFDLDYTSLPIPFSYTYHPELSLWSDPVQAPWLSYVPQYSSKDLSVGSKDSSGDTVRLWAYTTYETTVEADPTNTLFMYSSDRYGSGGLVVLFNASLE